MRNACRKANAGSITTRRFLGLMLTVAVVTASCRNPTAPTVAAITDLRYEHVIAFSIGADMRVDLEYWNCSGGPLDGPSTCPLTQDQPGIFHCQVPSFIQYMQRVPTTCDSHVDVRILSSTGNPLAQVAHDIYLNGTKVTRITSNPAWSYLLEHGAFRVDSGGHIQ